MALRRPPSNRWLGALAGLIASSPPAAAEILANSAVLAASWTLRDALAIAARENPELAAARSRWEAARARIAQAATPENPRLDIERMYAPRDANPFSGAAERNVAVSQELPFPTTLYFRSRKARLEAAQVEAVYRAKERQVMSRVKSAYALLYYSRHAIHVFESNAELMRQFSRVAEARYASGTALQSDVLKAQVELSRMLNMLVTLEQEKENNQAMLNTLLNRPPQAPLGAPPDPDPEALKQDLENLQAQALAARPELQEALEGVRGSRTAVTLARSEYLPDFMLGYRRRDMAGAPDSHDAIVGLSLPLWFWRQGARVREAQADRALAEAELAALKTMTLFDVKNLFVKAQTALRLIGLYESSVLPQAEQALKIAQAGYQAGKTGFLDLLDASRSLLDFRLEHYRHIADYERFVAELERAVGVELRGAR